MNFKIVLETLTKRFNGQNIDFALIGGLAVTEAGFSRATQDIDILVPLSDAEKVHKVMTELDYKILQKTNDFALYASDLEVFGRVDFLFAHRKISLGMLSRAKKKAIINNTITIKVLNPEDIIGLKVQSIANNPKRASKDMIDVEEIIKINKDNLNIDLIKEYFDIFDKGKELDELLKRI